MRQSGVYVAYVMLIYYTISTKNPSWLYYIHTIYIQYFITSLCAISVLVSVCNTIYTAKRKNWVERSAAFITLDRISIDDELWTIYFSSSFSILFYLSIDTAEMYIIQCKSMVLSILPTRTIFLIISNVILKIESFDISLICVQIAKFKHLFFSGDWHPINTGWVLSIQRSRNLSKYWNCELSKGT